MGRIDDSSLLAALGTTKVLQFVHVVRTEVQGYIASPNPSKDYEEFLIFDDNKNYLGAGSPFQLVCRAGMSYTYYPKSIPNPPLKLVR
jgi:hypothetical protein